MNPSGANAAAGSGGLVLAVDLGTSHLKVAFYDDALQAVHASVLSTPSLAGSRKGEIDPNSLWSGMRLLLAEAGSQVDLQRIETVGITGMAESGCLISEDNQPITPMLLWHDRRGIRQAAELRRRAGDSFSRITGLRTTNVRSIAKWKWMVEHGAPRDARWCGAPEWLALRLSGRWLTDSTLAVRTGTFDVLRGDYSAELLELAGAPPGLFAPVRGSPAYAGKIVPKIARELQLPVAVKIVIAGHDDIAAAYGAGGERGDLIDSGGTAEGLVRIVDEPPMPAATVKGKMALTRYYRSGTWALLAGAGSTGALMQQVATTFGVQPAQLDEEAAPAGQYHTDTLAVRLSKEGLPYVRLGADAAAPEVWSAVLDLVCERVAEAAVRLERLAGRPSRLILIGGAARSRELSRRKSRRLGLDAIRMPDIDATTRGAAALAHLCLRNGSPGLVPGGQYLTT